MKIKKFSVIGIVALFLTLMFLGNVWAAQTLKETKKSRRSKIVAYVGYSKLKPFWITLGQRVEEQLMSKKNIRYLDLTPSSLEDVDYVKSLKLAVNNKIDGIIIGVGADVSLIKPLLDRAEELGIIVIAIDTKVDHPAVKGFVTTDNFASAQIIGNYIVNETKKKGTVLILGGTKDHPNGDARRDGVITQVEASGMEVIFKQANWRNELAYKYTKEELSKSNSISAIFSCWDPGILSASKAIKNMNRNNDILLAGFDGLHKVYMDIKQSNISATIAQPIDEMAKKSVDMMVDLLEGSNTKTTFLIPGILVTSENVNEYLRE